MVIILDLKLDNRIMLIILIILIRCYLHLLCSQEDFYLKTVEDQKELQLQMCEYPLQDLFGTMGEYTLVQFMNYRR